MRIATLTSSYPRFPNDGSAPFVKSIAEAIAKAGHSVEVVAPYDTQVTIQYASPVKVHHFRYTPFKKMNIMGYGRALQADVRLQPLAFVLLPFYILAAFVSLWKVTGQQKSDAIHVHWVLPNGPIAAVVAKLRRIPFVVSLHGSDIYIADKNRMFGHVVRWVFHQASAVTACSPELKTHAVELGAPFHTKVIAWGADPMLFKPAEDRESVRALFGWGDETVIITLGRLVYKKGFDVLINALPGVLKKYPNIKVIIGGDGPILNSLSELVESLDLKDKVHFIGRISWNNVPDLFSAADIFVLPSVRDSSGNLDGLPTVLLEAMSSGLPVTASDIGGVPLVIEDHQNGLLITPGSTKELSDALISLIGDKAMYKKLGYAARKSIVDEFNWDNVAKKIVQAF